MQFAKPSLGLPPGTSDVWNDSSSSKAGFALHLDKQSFSHPLTPGPWNRLS